MDEALFDLVHPLGEGFQVDRGTERVKAECLGPVGTRDEAACCDHGLGGNTVPEVGRPADDVSFDKNDVCAEASRRRGGPQTRRPTANHHQSHLFTLLASTTEA
jgi:hypothetical protein